MSQRTQRVDELLRQEIGRILAKDVQDPRIGFATITAVETSPDLGHAKVRVSVIGGSSVRSETVAALERAMPFVRHELGGRLRLRRIPVLHVSLDESAERGTRVLQILEELELGHDAAGEALADAPLGETLPTPVTRLPREGDADEPEAAVPATTPRPRRRTRPDRSGAHPARHRRGRHPQDPK
jgi:ribosome-binding factor A